MVRFPAQPDRPPRLDPRRRILRLALLLAVTLAAGCQSTSSTPPPGPVFDPENAWVDQIQAPPELRRAILSGSEATIPVDAGYDIALRIYGQAGGKTPVVMTHGLQSHSGWFAQSAARMAAQGHPVYAVDRRGSGLSQGPRGDMKAFDEMIEDLLVVADDIPSTTGTPNSSYWAIVSGPFPPRPFPFVTPIVSRGWF